MGFVYYGLPGKEVCNWKSNKVGKKRKEKGSEEMQVPLRINKHKGNDDIFPMQQQQEQEQWEREVEKF